MKTLNRFALRAFRWLYLRCGWYIPTEPTWDDVSPYTFLYSTLYQFAMRLLHRFGLHYAPPKIMEDGATSLWCQWCGMRDIWRPYHGAIAIHPPNDRALKASRDIKHAHH